MEKIKQPILIMYSLTLMGKQLMNRMAQKRKMVLLQKPEMYMELLFYRKHIAKQFVVQFILKTAESMI